MNQTKISPGTEVYNVDVAPVVARGVAYSTAELGAMLSGPVKEVVFDSSGMNDIRDLLESVATTVFSTEAVKRILNSQPVPHDWRVGEAIAEVFLINHRCCLFPWPGGRDLKNPNASPAGTDLVGFQQLTGESNGHRFAFGEVKTSAQETWPPSSMDGRSGLNSQIESLRDSSKVKDSLVKYLGLHAQNATWLPVYKSAAAKYLADPTDVSLFGLLIRDVKPKSQDLNTRASALGSQCPKVTSIELRAIYLPEKTIPTLGPAIVALKKDGDDSN